MDCNNYRPISVLSSISKVPEKIVAEKLVYLLNINDMLYQNQYGFLTKRLMEHNLMQVLNFVIEALNDNMFCIFVLFDLRKGFDVCSHDILLAKLEWFKNDLFERTVIVDINGSFSNPCSLDISVIQGSNLGPILFLCYINDFWLVTTLFSVLHIC